MKSIALPVLLVYLFATCTAFPKSLDSASEELNDNGIDQLIEKEITDKLTQDILDSIAAKFHKDLEKAVALAMSKINVLLQNGTEYIERKYGRLRELVDDVSYGNGTNASCIQEHDKLNDVVTKQALHQMVLCGYALIGHEPEAPLVKVNEIKDYINQQIMPLNESVVGLRNVVKDCGHAEQHLNGVIRCVILKSHPIKTVMIKISQRLTEEITEFTKLVAHGAMHEACLLEVLSSVEDRALGLAAELKVCLQRPDLEPQRWTPETRDDNLNVSRSIVSEFDLEAVFKEYNRSKHFVENTNDVEELLRYVWPDKKFTGLPATFNETDIENFLYNVEK